MTDSMLFRTDVSSDNQFAYIPAVVEFAIDASTAAEIVQLATLVKTRGLYKVEKFDRRATYLRFDPETDREEIETADEDNEVRTEAEVLNVSDESFWYSAYLKHTDVEVHSEHQSVEELAQRFGLSVHPSS